MDQHLFLGLLFLLYAISLTSGEEDLSKQKTAREGTVEKIYLRPRDTSKEMLRGSVIWFKPKNQGERQSKKLDEEKSGENSEGDINKKKKQTKRKKNSKVSVNDKIKRRMGQSKSIENAIDESKVDSEITQSIAKQKKKVEKTKDSSEKQRKSRRKPTMKNKEEKEATKKEQVQIEVEEIDKSNTDEDKHDIIASKEEKIDPP